MAADFSDRELWLLWDAVSERVETAAEFESDDGSGTYFKDPEREGSPQEWEALMGKLHDSNRGTDLYLRFFKEPTDGG